MADDLAERAALDAILLGEESDRTDDAWRRLVEEPGGALAWGAAVERRARIDRAAALLARAPWSAPLLRRLGRMRRRTAEPSWPWQAPGAGWLVGKPALARALDSGTSRPVEVVWGETTFVQLALGEQIELRLQDVAAASLWSVGQVGPVLLRGRAWRLEPAEAPVVLVVAGGSAIEDFDLAVERATALAVVVLEESAAEDD